MKKISILYSLLFNVLMSVTLAAVTGFSIVAVMSFVFFFSLIPFNSFSGIFARIFLTDFIGDIYGKVGATVYKKNFYGLCRIMKPQPKNPQSEAQKNMRAKFGGLYDLYLSLTSLQYLQWKNLAKSTPFIKKGKSYYLDVMPFFVKCNQNLQLIGESAIADAPNWSDAPQTFETFSVDVVTTPGAEDITLNISPAIANSTKIKLYSTGVVGVRQNSVSNKYKFLGYLDDAFITGGSIKNDYEGVFGVMPKTGDTTYFAIESVVKATGRCGMRYTSKTIGTP